jgi:hypothetical protein
MRLPITMIVMLASVPAYAADKIYERHSPSGAYLGTMTCRGVGNCDSYDKAGRMVSKTRREGANIVTRDTKGRVVSSIRTVPSQHSGQ